MKYFVMSFKWVHWDGRKRTLLKDKMSSIHWKTTTIDFWNSNWEVLEFYPVYQSYCSLVGKLTFIFMGGRIYSEAVMRNNKKMAVSFNIHLDISMMSYQSTIIIFTIMSTYISRSTRNKQHHRIWQICFTSRYLN